MKKILFFTAAVFLIFVVASCESGEVLDDGRSIVGTWKCIGFGNAVSADSFKEIVPKDCEECFILTFKEDGSCEGFTVSNEILGTYEIKKNKRNITLTLATTKIKELYDGGLYSAILRHSISNYAFSAKGELLLYYNGEKEWLVFKSV